LIWRCIIAQVLLLGLFLANAAAQTLPCQVDPVLCDNPKSKLKLNLNFDFSIKLGTKPRAVVRPSKVARPPKAKVAIVKSKPVQPKPQPLLSAPKPKIIAEKTLTPKHSWDGLREIPVTILEPNDFLDIPNQFIIDFNLDAFKAAGLDLRTITQVDLATQLGIEPSQIRSVQRRFLLSAVLLATPKQVATLKLNPLIKLIEADTPIKAAGAKLPLSWGLDRLDSPSLPLDSHFDRDFGDYQTRIYLFDTGIDQSHSEFGNRVKFGASFVKPQLDKSIKCREHGTEMASLIGGQTTGSAPKTEIVQLVVLPCDRNKTGEASSLIEAAEWLLVREADYGDGKPAIANMSLAGKWSRKINQAVSVLTENEVAVVVAAGNNAQDACRFSPASAKDAITVAATGPKDETPGFSNFGQCVDINAPGRLLTALTEGKVDQYIASNGTSGATALVSGLLARSLKSKGPKAADIWLANASVPSKLWRKDQPDMLMAQVNPDLKNFCRVAPQNVEVNVRISPNQASKVFKTLAPGVVVRVMQMDNEWVKIVTPGGNKGWISKASALLELDQDVACEATH
jgi:Subtilase family/Bacterial SH3 domain